MGKEKRGKQGRAKSPGPGAYSGNSNFVKKKGPSYGLGVKTKPDFSYLNKGPGPGAYSIN